MTGCLEVFLPKLPYIYIYIGFWPTIYISHITYLAFSAQKMQVMVPGLSDHVFMFVCWWIIQVSCTVGRWQWWPKGLREGSQCWWHRCVCACVRVCVCACVRVCVCGLHICLCFCGVSPLVGLTHRHNHDLSLSTTDLWDAHGHSKSNKRRSCASCVLQFLSVTNGDRAPLVCFNL